MMRVGNHTNASPARTTPPPPAPAGGLPLAFAILLVSKDLLLAYSCRRTPECRDLLCTSTSAVMMVSAPVDMSLEFANGPLSPARQARDRFVRCSLPFTAEKADVRCPTAVLEDI
jgi:hypothetical protein